MNHGHLNQSWMNSPCVSPACVWLTWEHIQVSVQKYKQLVSEGRFQETLLEMYRWGKQHAWDPLALRPPTPPA